MNFLYLNTVSFSIIFKGKRPTERYLNFLIVERYATQWRNIGLALALPPHELDNIEANNKGCRRKVQTCCSDMFERWLKMDTNPTWGKLFEVIDQINNILDSCTGWLLMLYKAYTTL